MISKFLGEDIMWTVVISIILGFLACLSFMIGLGKRLPKLLKWFQIGFLVISFVPMIMFIIELIVYQFNRPGYFITHIVSIIMLFIAKIGLRMDANSIK